MTRHLLLPTAASLGAVLALSACVPTTPAPASESPFAAFAAADDAGQIEQLLAAEDAVAAQIAAPPTAAGALAAPRAGTRDLVFRDISSISEVVADALRSDAEAPADSGQVGWGDGRYSEWTRTAGTLTGTYTLDIDGGAEAESSFTLAMCPDPSGRFSGHAKLVGTSGGVGWDVVFNFSGQVGDDAWSDDMVVEAAGTLDAGGITQDSNTTVSFGFGEQGTWGVAGDGTAGSSDGGWDRAVDDFASKASLRLARLLEENWRSGACVGINSTPEGSASVAPGEELPFVDVQPFSYADGADITSGTIEGTLIAGDGEFTPEGKLPVGTDYLYSAPLEPGTATVQFLAISRRGVGLVEIPIEILGGWTFTQTYNEVTSSALKCGGLTGSWVMASTAPWAYEATTTWTFDESLTATATIAGTSGGYGFGGTHTVWLEEAEDGVWELHSDDGPNVFYLLPAPAGACD